METLSDRNYFAGQALNALIIHHGVNGNINDLSAMAFVIADSMLVKTSEKIAERSAEEISARLVAEVRQKSG